MDAQRFNMPRRTVRFLYFTIATLVVLIFFQVPLDPNPVDLDITDCDSVTSSFFSSEDDIISSSTSFEDITDTLNQSTFDEPSAPPPSASASAFLFSSPSLGALDSSLIMEELEEVAAIRARQNVMDSQRFDMSKSKNKNFQAVVIEPEVRTQS